jgi:AcrR family transcriptional regulator
VNDAAGIEPRRRGRPRSERAREAILAAAAELLLAKGIESVSMDEVAERAGVSKATIYRWWPSKQTLALDALLQEWEIPPALRETGSLRGDLLALIRPWVGRLRKRPYARVISGLLAETYTDPVFAEYYRARFVAVRRDPARALLGRAIEHGELPADTNIDLALDLVFGPIYHRLLHGHAPLTDGFARAVVDAALAGLGYTPRQGPPRAPERPSARVLQRGSRGPREP